MSDYRDSPLRYWATQLKTLDSLLPIAVLRSSEVRGTGDSQTSCYGTSMSALHLNSGHFTIHLRCPLSADCVEKVLFC